MIAGAVLVNEYLEKFFAALADGTRLRALVLLHHEGELCVCELVAALDELQPKISRHIAVLREAGIVIGRRDANRSFYRIAESLSDWARRILDETAAAAEGGLFVADQARLAMMPDRPERRSAA